MAGGFVIVVLKGEDGRVWGSRLFWWHPLAKKPLGNSIEFHYGPWLE
jgi:hypothetical protein